MEVALLHCTALYFSVFHILKTKCNVPLGASGVVDYYTEGDLCSTAICALTKDSHCHYVPVTDHNLCTNYFMQPKKHFKANLVPDLRVEDKWARVP